MSDIEQLITKVAAQNTRDPLEVQDICQKTIEDYQCLETMDEGGGGGTMPLRMIAWDRRCSS